MQEIIKGKNTHDKTKERRSETLIPEKTNLRRYMYTHICIKCIEFLNKSMRNTQSSTPDLSSQYQPGMKVIFHIQCQ